MLGAEEQPGRGGSGRSILEPDPDTLNNWFEGIQLCLSPNCRVSGSVLGLSLDATVHSRLQHDRVSE